MIPARTRAILSAIGIDWHDGYENVELLPTDIHYSSEGIFLGKIHFLIDNPRLAFAKAISQFGVWETDLLSYDGGNWVMDGINTMGVGMGNGNVIGNSGFGYVKDNDGSWFEMPHFGSVVFGPGVQIGNNNNIDRGVIGDTVIGEGTKIDSLVHVAHNCQIGKRCLIVAGAIIGGSVEIGDHSFIGMNASIKQKVKIGKNCIIGAGAVVLNDVPDGETWAGVPAIKIK